MAVRPAPAAELPEEMINEVWRTCLKTEQGNGDDDEGPEIYAPDNGAECRFRGWPIYLWEHREEACANSTRSKRQHQTLIGYMPIAKYTGRKVTSMAPIFELKISSSKLSMGT
jgi:hypothetical protein